MVHVVKNPFMEMLTFHIPAEYCDKSLEEYCFIAGHFDWCLKNETTFVNSDGACVIHHTSKVWNDDGSEEIKTEIFKERKCSHPDPRAYSIR